MCIIGGSDDCSSGPWRRRKRPGSSGTFATWRVRVQRAGWEPAPGGGPGRTSGGSMTKLRVLLAGLLWTAVMLVVAPAHAAGEVITLSPASGAPGAVTTVTGTGFAASSVVDVYLDGRQLDFAITDATGKFTYALTVPRSATPGNHTVTALAHNGSGGA